MSDNFLKDDRVMLNENLELTVLKSISFNDRFGNSDSVDPRRLFDKFSFNQRSHLRNVYIAVSLNSFYVASNVDGGINGLEREISK